MHALQLPNSLCSIKTSFFTLHGKARQARRKIHKGRTLFDFSLPGNICWSIALYSWKTELYSRTRSSYFHSFINSDRAWLWLNSSFQDSRFSRTARNKKYLNSQQQWQQLSRTIINLSSPFLKAPMFLLATIWVPFLYGMHAYITNMPNLYWKNYLADLLIVLMHAWQKNIPLTQTISDAFYR